MAKSKSTRSTVSGNNAGIPAVAYYRMSSDKQEASIPEQVKAVEHFAAERGYRIIRDYADEGISGDATEKRHAFQQMIRDAADGEFQAILCWDMDRFGRFDSIEAGHWIKPLRDVGVKLVTVAQGEIDWEDFAGRIVYNVQAEAKHAYLRDLSRNVLRGHCHAAAEGKFLGGNPPLGYRVVNGEWKIDRPKAALVRRIYRMYLAGESLRGIANTLNAEGVPSPQAGRRRGITGRWSTNSVAVILSNDSYTGTHTWNRGTHGKYNHIHNGQPTSKRADRGRFKQNDPSDWFVIDDHHPVIIDRDTFESVQERKAARKGACTPTSNPTFRFTGLLVCGQCGCHMHGEIVTNALYVCFGNKQRGQSFCLRNSVFEDELIDVIGSTLQGRLLNDRAVDQIRKELQRQIGESMGDGRRTAKRLERRLADLDREIEEATRRLRLVDVDMLGVLQDAIRGLRQERQQAEVEYIEARKSKDERFADASDKIDRALGRMRNLTDCLRTAEPRIVREMLATTFDKIELFVGNEMRGTRRRYWLAGGRMHLNGKVSNALSRLWSLG